jgi:cytochrome c peroxidase
MQFKQLAIALFFLPSIYSCSTVEKEVIKDYPAVKATFGNKIDLFNLAKYSQQEIPGYITKDNSGSNPITNQGATLGRILFYDVNLSKNNTISCASCHKQSLAFSDNERLSTGVNGQTGRHSMRLVNSRFGNEFRFFWDERAVSLEDQVTQPIKDHDEMGFSGTNGDPDFNALIRKLEAIDYYKELFEFVYEDNKITEERIKKALAQFIRSIQSFDSKYDLGRAQVNNNLTNFPNFTTIENQGKLLFTTPPQFSNGERIGGGAGCQGCHRAPEFDIDPNSRNNGVIGVAGNPAAKDLKNTRSPSLRNLMNPGGSLNGQLMHDGSFSTLEEVIDHYNNIPSNPENNELDNRLRPQGLSQKLNLTNGEKEAIVAFLKTLTGNQVYTAEKWANPFN